MYEATFTWNPEPNAEGYRLYKNASLIATLGAGATSLVQEYADSEGVFEIEAFNRWGVGPRTVAVVTVEDASNTQNSP